MQTPSTHLLHRLTIFVRLGVISSAFAWVIASSGTWGSIWLQFSCYSWWSPPPRQLGATEEDWYELVIVCGHLLVIVRGFVPSPAESQSVTPVDHSCHWATSLVGRFLWCPSEDEVRATPLSHRTTKCCSTQWGHSVSASTWTLGENSLSPLWLFIGFLPMIGLHIIVTGSSPLRGDIKIKSSHLLSCKLE